MYRYYILILLFGTLIITNCGVDEPNQLYTFGLDSVELLNSPFKDAQQTNKEYLLELNVDRLMAPYLIESGLEPKAPKYENWENTGLDGHIGGHYLTALALMYASTADAEILDLLHYAIEELERAQRANGNGYIGGIPNGDELWSEIQNGNIRASAFGLNDRWVPLYNLHKLFAGLRDAYLIAEIDKAKDILIDLTEWFLKVNATLSDDQIQDMLRSEHGGLNEVFADIYVITENEDYLELSKKYSHNAILNPLMNAEDDLTGKHANTQIPKVIGYQRVAEETINNDWKVAVKRFWDNVVEDRSLAFGGNSVREHFNPTNDFSTMIEANQGPETCNTYNMLKLTKLLFTDEPNAKYINFYERALYNHILSSQHPEGGFVYFTPIRPRHYRVYSQPHTSFWCCVGSGIENHGKYGEMIYAHDQSDLYVNLFIPSTLNWEEKGVKIIQTNRFPYEESTRIRVQTKEPKSFKIFIRKPSWIDGDIRVSINGVNVDIEENSFSYVAVENKWNNGDIITIELPMKTYVEYLPDNSPWVSYLKGPIVLAAITDTTDITGLYASKARMAHVADGKFYPINEAPALIAENSRQLERSLTEVGPMVFEIQDLIRDDKWQDLRLVPFYTIHEARYMMYWPVFSESEYEQKQVEIRNREAQKIALEARTIDLIATGEQQPESDHSFRGEDSEIGIYEGRHWRHAKGWFSYELYNSERLKSKLRVTYSGADRGRTFDILINDTIIETVSSTGNSDTFFTVDYRIPEELITDTMTVKFQAHQNSMAGGVFEIRLLKED